MNNKEEFDISSLPDCFQSLFPDQLLTLQEKKIRLDYLKGESIFKQGAFAPYVMYVYSGLVRLFIQADHDKQVNLRIAKAGDFIAFSSIFDEKIYNYSAISIKDCQICMIDKEMLRELLMSNSEFAMKITTKNFKNESLLLEIIRSLSYRQMRGKLATAILYLSQEEFLKEDIFNYLSRQEIADFAAISTESAIKFLKEFEKDKIVSLNKKQITITNYDKLLQISRVG